MTSVGSLALNPPGVATVRPKVSALVSTYNAGRFIRGCLEDLEAQTLADRLEVLVIDSGSQQNEGRVVAEFQRRYTNLVYHRTEQREGLYAAWNRGIQLARGEYLTTANTDDRHAPQAFETLARALDQHPEIGLVYARTAITDQENATLATAPIRGCFRAKPFSRQRLFRDCLPGPQPMWRRQLHERFGLFDPELVSAGDYEFWLRISAEVQFLAIPEVLGLFLESPTSVSHQHAERAREETERARDRHWPAAWGPRAREHRPWWDRLTRRGTYRALARRLREGFGKDDSSP